MSLLSASVYRSRRIASVAVIFSCLCFWEYWACAQRLSNEEFMANLTAISDANDLNTVLSGYPPNEQRTWQDVRSQTWREVWAKAQQDVSLERAYQDLGVTYPPKRSLISMDEAQRRVEARMKNGSGPQLQPFDEAKARRQVEETYPLWRIGDRVSFTDGLGRRVEGKLIEANRVRVRVGDRTVSSADFTDDILTHTDETARQKAVEKAVKRLRGKDSLATGRAQQEALTAAQAEVCGPNGFTLCDGKWYTTQGIADFAEQHRRKMTTRRATAYYPQALTLKGFALLKGQWYPKAVVAAYDAEQAAGRAAGEKYVRENMFLGGRPVGGSFASFDDAWQRSQGLSQMNAGMMDAAREASMAGGEGTRVLSPSLSESYRPTLNTTTGRWDVTPFRRGTGADGVLFDTMRGE